MEEAFKWHGHLHVFCAVFYQLLPKSGSGVARITCDVRVQGHVFYCDGLRKSLPVHPQETWTEDGKAKPHMYTCGLLYARKDLEQVQLKAAELAALENEEMEEDEEV